jgi:hypothetical protein
MGSNFSRWYRAAFATAIGVVFVAFQFRQAKKQAQIAFEDDCTRQYRDIIQRISVRALLNESLDDELFEKDLNEIYNYFDLTNEQTFLRKQRRVTLATWRNWRDGIQSNMALPASSGVLDLIKTKELLLISKGCAALKRQATWMIRLPEITNISVVLSCAWITSKSALL